MFVQQNFQLGLLLKLRSSLELVRWADMNDGWGGGDQYNKCQIFYFPKEIASFIKSYTVTLTCAFFVNKLGVLSDVSHLRNYSSGNNTHLNISHQEEVWWSSGQAPWFR
jgi:hypothetical protein